MSVDETIAELDSLDAGDPEFAHSQADDVLLRLAGDEVRAAYKRLQERCRWWAHA